MKITRISVWALKLPLARPYSLAGGRLHFDHLDSTFQAGDLAVLRQIDTQSG